MYLANYYRLIIFVLLSCFCSAAYAEGKLVGFIKIKGDTLISRKSVGDAEWQRIANGARIFDGDSLKNGPNTIAEIKMFSGGDIYMGPSQQRQIPGERKKKSFFEKIQSIKLLSFLFDQDASLVHGSARGNELKVLFPRNGKILSTHPDFAWAQSSRVASYELILYENPGEDCQEEDGSGIWRFSTKDTVHCYPEQQAVLTPGTYYWLELKQISPKPEMEITDCFLVAPEAEAAAIRDTLALIAGQYAPTDSANISRALISGSYLLDREYYSDALDYFAKAHRFQPENPLLKDLLEIWGEKTRLSGFIKQLLAKTDKN